MVKAIDLIGSNSQLQNHWVRRFAAIIVDVIILGLISWIIFTVAIGLPGAWTFTIIPFFSGLIWLGYSAVLEMMMGATLGKQLFGLRVVSLEGPMDIVKALIRNVSKVYGWILLIDWLVGFFTDGDPRQRWLDRFAGTTVVRTDAQEIFIGAFQPPTGPLPAPYSPGQASQYPSQQPYSGASQPRSGPQPQQQYAAPQAQDSGATTAQEEKIESIGEEAKSEFKRDELVNLRKDELIKICRDKNLKISGTKRDLIDRILGEEVPD
jgi:uncharacterized RDD family membrane protein YckC